MGVVLTRGDLTSERARLRRDGKKVVFTNGVFDILHRGHAEYLEQARSLGDVLVVGVNSDASVRRIKGARRPIVPEADRAFLLAHLTPVDYVCVFGEDTPAELIAALVPDVLVKGADWNPEDIVGRETVQAAGGRVATIPYLPGRSTTSIIDRILERFGPQRDGSP